MIVSIIVGVSLIQSCFFILINCIVTFINSWSIQLVRKLLIRISSNRTANLDIHELIVNSRCSDDH